MFESILNDYAPEWRGEIKQGASGWNNTTRFIEGVHRGVLRIYETHRDRDKIEFEHAVLESLRGRMLHIGTPVPVRSTTGDTIVRLSDGSGRYACMFEFMEGMQPWSGDARPAHSFGVAAGALASELAGIEPSNRPSYRPYYELQQSYPACSREAVMGLCQHPAGAFADLRDLLTGIAEAYDHVCGQRKELEQLPHQLVHGDLNYSNLLVDPEQPERVTGLLDFEFCTMDVRAMEPAVIISGLLGKGADGGQEAVRQFCKGYGSQVRLLPREADAIPVLMRLRNVDVFLHFMSRYFNGTDGPQVLLEQVESVSGELSRIDLNQAWIMECLTRYVVRLS